jgi:hypothetical protein
MLASHSSSGGGRSAKSPRLPRQQQNCCYNVFRFPKTALLSGAGGALSFAAERDRQLVIRNLGNEQQVRLQGILQLFQAEELKGPPV